MAIDSILTWTECFEADEMLCLESTIKHYRYKVFVTTYIVTKFTLGLSFSHYWMYDISSASDDEQL